MTVPSRDGILLIAFLALFVTWSGHQIWWAFSYYIHRKFSSLYRAKHSVQIELRSTPEPRDALHHQQQILLRVGYNNIGFLWRLIQITWSWRRIQGSTSRNLPLLILAIVHLALVIVASIFTSRIAVSDGLVLVLPNHCGWTPFTYFDLTNLTTESLAPDDATFYAAHWASHRSQNYARMCYSSGQTDGITSGCNGFVQTTLSKTVVNYSDVCPFHDNICDTTALYIRLGVSRFRPRSWH